MKTTHRTGLLASAAALALLASAAGAMAQTAPQAQPVDPQDSTTIDDVVVVGTQIRGAPTTDEHVWSAQTRALEAAQDMEETARAAAEERNRAIDAQSQ